MKPFERYLDLPNHVSSEIGGLQACERVNADEIDTTRDFSIHVESDLHGYEKHEKSASHAGLHDYTDKNPKTRHEELSDRFNGGNGAGEFRCDIVGAPDGGHLITPPCDQCGAGRSDDPPTEAVSAKNGKTVFVHPECLRFWKKEHGDAPAPGDDIGAHA